MFLMIYLRLHWCIFKSDFKDWIQILSSYSRTKFVPIQFVAWLTHFFLSTNNTAWYGLSFSKVVQELLSPSPVKGLYLYYAFSLIVCKFPGLVLIPSSNVGEITDNRQIKIIIDKNKWENQTRKKTRKCVKHGSGYGPLVLSMEVRKRFSIMILQQCLMRSYVLSYFKVPLIN